MYELNDASSATWREIVDSYVADASPSAEALGVIAQFREKHPLSVATAVEPAFAERCKDDFGGFVLHAIGEALTDHVLSDSEVDTLRHLCRILRIREGDLLKYHRPAVVGVLTTELRRLLEDEVVDPAEALHKVRLQELLGLSYDEFVALTAPEVERVLIKLMHRLDGSAAPADLSRNITWFRGVLSALDTVYNLNPGGQRTDRSGFVYLLVNPAMPGILKIGRTARAPAARILELSGATGVPMPFDLLFQIHVLDAHAAERYVHDKLDERGARVTANREFFNVQPSTAVEILLEARDAIGPFGVERKRPARRA